MFNVFDEVTMKTDAMFINGWSAEVESDNGFYQLDDFEDYVLITDGTQSIKCYSVDEAMKIIK